MSAPRHVGLLFPALDARVRLDAALASVLPVKVTAAKTIIHEPWVQQVGGQATDFEIHARDLIATRRALAGKYEETIKNPIDHFSRISSAISI